MPIGFACRVFGWCEQIVKLGLVSAGEPCCRLVVEIRCRVTRQLVVMGVSMLLALIHSRMNMGPSAWRYAESMKKYFTEISETPDWELAFVYAIHAWAALACGKLDEYKASYLKARS